MQNFKRDKKRIEEAKKKRREEKNQKRHEKRADELPAADPNQSATSTAPAALPPADNPQS